MFDSWTGNWGFLHFLDTWDISFCDLIALNYVLKYLTYMWTRPRYPGKSKDRNVFHVFTFTGSNLFSIPQIPQYCQTQIKGQFAQNSNATDSFRTIVDGDPGDISSSCVINLTLNGGAIKLHTWCYQKHDRRSCTVAYSVQKGCAVTTWISIDVAGNFEWTVLIKRSSSIQILWQCVAESHLHIL